MMNSAASKRPRCQIHRAIPVLSIRRRSTVQTARASSAQPRMGVMYTPAMSSSFISGCPLEMDQRVTDTEQRKKYLGTGGAGVERPQPVGRVVQHPAQLVDGHATTRSAETASYGGKHRVDDFARRGGQQFAV